MPTLEIDGTVVPLRPQKRHAFEQITALVFDEADDDRDSDALYVQHLDRLCSEGHGHDDSLVQAGMWALHDLGVRTIRRNDEGALEVSERIETPASRGDADGFGHAAVRDGRAFAAAISNIRTRTMTFNGERVAIKRHSKESVEAVMQFIARNRLVDEDLLMTTVRVIAALIEQPESDEMQSHISTAFEIATDLGIDELTIDPDGSVEIGRLNIGNAMASAVLQGFEPDDVVAIRKRLEALNRQ